MATVQHNVLTGSALHEPKGVASASANRVYVANGLGSGTWSQLTTASIDATSIATIKAFQEQLFHVSDVRASGTNGGIFNNGAWQTRILNTTNVNGISGASLSGNQLILPTGSYIIMAEAVANSVDQNQLRLQNVTDATTALTGMNTVATGVAIIATLTGKFTLLAGKTLELQHRCLTSHGPDGFGSAIGFGSEHYAEVMIWKVA